MRKQPSSQRASGSHPYSCSNGAFSDMAIMDFLDRRPLTRPLALCPSLILVEFRAVRGEGHASCLRPTRRVLSFLLFICRNRQNEQGPVALFCQSASPLQPYSGSNSQTGDIGSPIMTAWRPPKTKGPLARLMGTGKMTRCCLPCCANTHITPGKAAFGHRRTAECPLTNMESCCSPCPPTPT